MSHYVVFTVGPDGHFMLVRDVWATSHGDAVQQVKLMVGKFDLEIWCKGRWIATLSANSRLSSKDEWNYGVPLANFSRRFPVGQLRIGQPHQLVAESGFGLLVFGFIRQLHSDRGELANP